MEQILCPKCQCQYPYQDGEHWVCPECFFEWRTDSAMETKSAELESQVEAIKDAHGNILNTGDSVTVIKELRIKGSSSVVKVGTKVRNIRLTPDVDGHNIACKIDGIGSINLKSEFVKKA